jgi:hypothetical protein
VAFSSFGYSGFLGNLGLGLGLVGVDEGRCEVRFSVESALDKRYDVITMPSIPRAYFAP